MVPFNYPNNSLFGIISFLQDTNAMCEGLLGVAILIIVGFVAFVSTKSYTFERAFGFAGFLTLIIAVFLRFLSLINDAILFLVVVIFIGSVIALMRERNVEEFAT